MTELIPPTDMLLMAGAVLAIIRGSLCATEMWWDGLAKMTRQLLRLRLISDWSNVGGKLYFVAVGAVAVEGVYGSEDGK